MPRITLIAAAALTALALFVPAATAMPADPRQLDMHASTVHKPATTQRDLRSADARDAAVTPQTGTPASGQEFRTPDAVDAGRKPAEPLDPQPIAAPVDAAPVSGDDDTSPLVYILPGIALSLLLAASLGYAVRTSRRAGRAHIGA
jgi:hypothetical protein